MNTIPKEQRLNLFKTLDLTDFTANIKPDREIVACWNKDGYVQLIENTSTQPGTFGINNATIKRISNGEIIGILHSHLPGMDVDLSPSDIRFADFYGVDIASYSSKGEKDYFSPFLPHPYPLLVDNIYRFFDRRYENFRSDCYRFIENCFCFIGHQLPTIPRSDDMYKYDENFQLQMLKDIAGWKFKHGDKAYTGDLLILRFDTESHHFGLVIEDKVLFFGYKGVRCLPVSTAKTYTTHTFELAKKANTDKLACFDLVLQRFI